MWTAPELPRLRSVVAPLVRGERRSPLTQSDRTGQPVGSDAELCMHVGAMLRQSVRGLGKAAIPSTIREESPARVGRAAQHMATLRPDTLSVAPLHQVGSLSPRILCCLIGGRGQASPPRHATALPSGLGQEPCSSICWGCGRHVCQFARPRSVGLEGDGTDGRSAWAGCAGM